MLTKRQNLLETIKKGGKPDRFVKQFEFLNLNMPACFMMGDIPFTPGRIGKSPWDVTFEFKEGQIGPFPLHDDQHKVIKDIIQWRKYVKKPVVPTSDEAWAPAIGYNSIVDRNEEFAAVWFAPGVFEMTHHLMGIEESFFAYYEEPEAMHELIDCITEYELEYAKVVTEKLHIDALFHHDDWGSSTNSLLSPDIFKEFILPAYKKIYGLYKANGVELIVHHSDSYAANLVPFMVEMGVDIWQGAIPTNNIPELIKQYDGQIAFMGEIETKEIDLPDWTPEAVANEVERACRKCGKFAFIPCQTQGGPYSSFPGVYDEVGKQIDRMSKEMF
jgi:hypothetical protein